MNTIKFVLSFMILGIGGYYIGKSVTNIYLKREASKKCSKEYKEFIKIADEAKALEDSLYLYSFHYSNYSGLVNDYSPDTVLMFISKNEAITEELVSFSKQIDTSCFIYPLLNKLEETIQERFEIFGECREAVNDHENKKVKVKESQL